MNERRRALLAKFRASAADRLRRVASTLIALREGSADEGAQRDLAREIHTLKGESNMMGMPAVSAALHAAEGLLRGDGLAGEGAFDLMQTTLDRVGAAIQGTLPDEAMELEVIGAAIAAFLAPKTPGPTTARSGAAEGARSAGVPSAPPSTRDAPRSLGRATTSASASGSRSSASTGSTEAAPPRDRWVQIEAGRVDDLCERISGFATDFRALAAQIDRLGALGAGDAAEAFAPTRAALRMVSEEFDRCRARLDDIADTSWSLRLSPVEPVLADLGRYARELAEKQGKRLRVTVRAGSAAVERSLLDELWDPLLHLVRNAIDHGIEPPGERGDKSPEATLSLLAEPVGPNVQLTVRDDGRGIDPERVRAAARARGLVSEEAAQAMDESHLFGLLFTHGFSTRDTVSDVSGRGVGLDVVRQKVEAFGGAVSVSSRPGEGTHFALTLPATVSRERCLVVEVGGALYGVVARGIVELVRLGDHPIEAVVGGRSLRYHDEPIPLRSLSATLGVGVAVDEPWVMIVELAARPWAFTIPRVLGEFELLRRPLDPQLSPLGYLGASSTLDDGRLVLILLLAGLLRRSEARVGPAPRAVIPARRRKVLVVDDAPMVREMLADTLTEAGLEVVTADDGPEALAVIDRGAPDLVLSDIDMPVMSGFELVRNIRLRFRSLPIVMLSARSSDDDRQRAAAAGADAYLVKSSFNTSALLDAVTRFLGARG